MKRGDPDGSLYDTPLMVAAWRNSLNALRFLLTWPDGLVKVNRANNLGETALHCAAFAGSVAGARLLLQHGANVEAPDRYWFTPLHCAVEPGSEQVVRILVDAGANIEAICRYHFRRTCTLRAIELAAILGHWEIFK